MILRSVCVERERDESMAGGTTGCIIIDRCWVPLVMLAALEVSQLCGVAAEGKTEEGCGNDLAQNKRFEVRLTEEGETLLKTNCLASLCLLMMRDSRQFFGNRGVQPHYHEEKKERQ